MGEKCINKFKYHFWINFLRSPKAIILATVIYFIIYFSVFAILGLSSSTINDNLITYLTRISTLIIPTSLAVFTFSYKEKKEASYLGVRTSNLKLPIICVNVLALITLISCGILSFNSIDSTSAMANSPQGREINLGQFLLTLLNLVINLVAFIWFIISIVNRMNLERSLKRSINKTNKLNSFLKTNYHTNFLKQKQIDGLFSRYAEQMETNFQLFHTLLNVGQIREPYIYRKKLINTNNNFNENFINTTDISNLKVFINRHSDGLKTLSSIYDSILINYRRIIRCAADNKLTLLQNELIKALVTSSPSTLLDTQPETKIKDPKYEELIRRLFTDYFSAIFELITELSEKETVEYSYLLDSFTEETKQTLTILRTYKNFDYNETHRLYYQALLPLLESITVWSMESKDINYLTESVNIILNLKKYLIGSEKEIKKTDIQNIVENSAILRNKQINKKNLNQSITLTIGSKSEDFRKETDPDFNEKMEKDMLKILFISLLKSIEISSYQNTGYLIKIITSHFELTTVENYIGEFFYRYKSIENHSFNLNYFHYSINQHSKEYCLQKMLLLMSAQILYRKGSISNVTLLKEIPENEFWYLKSKLLNAETYYGLLSINKKIIERIENIVASHFQNDSI